MQNVKVSVQIEADFPGRLRNRHRGFPDPGPAHAELRGRLGHPQHLHRALRLRRHDGLSWAVLFNQRSDDKRLPDTAIDGALHRAADAVTAWPAENLFSKW